MVSGSELPGDYSSMDHMGIVQQPKYREGPKEPIGTLESPKGPSEASSLYRGTTIPVQVPTPTPTYVHPTKEFLGNIRATFGEYQAAIEKQSKGGCFRRLFSSCLDRGTRAIKTRLNFLGILDVDIKEFKKLTNELKKAKDALEIETRELEKFEKSINEAGEATFEKLKPKGSKTYADWKAYLDGQHPGYIALVEGRQRKVNELNKKLDFIKTYEYPMHRSFISASIAVEQVAAAQQQVQVPEASPKQAQPDKIAKTLKKAASPQAPLPQAQPGKKGTTVAKKIADYEKNIADFEKNKSGG
jgi:hypothetical protein